MPRRQLLAPVLAHAALATFLLAPARAADTWPVPRGDSHEPKPFRYDAKLWKDVPKEFLDDAAACVLHAGTTHLVDADGTIETITHDVTRLNGRKAIEKMGEYRGIVYSPGYQKIALNVARIHKADGRITEIEPRHVQVRDVGTDYLTFDHDKTLIISFPSLEVGDTIEVKWTVRGKNPEHGGQFFARYAFGDATYPVVADEFCVRLPKTMPFKHATAAGKVEPTVTEEGERRTYGWKQTNVRQLPQDENMPPKEELRPTVACTTFADWQAVGKWKKDLRAECWKCTTDITKAVADITKDLDDDTAKARALTYWLRRNIRYVADGEAHDYTPHPPSRVFGNRFGDCKDTSQLLAVMLREAGLKVELATLGAYDDGQVLEAVPSPWGTHAILLVTIAGKAHWIDTTASLAGWDFLPHDDRDRLCYVVDEQGTIHLVRTPPLNVEENRFEQTTHIYVGADGSSRCERSVTTYGSAAMGQRDSYLEVPNGERRRLVTSELQDASSRSRLLKLGFEEPALRDLDKPVTVQMSYDVASHFSGKPNLEGSITDSRVWGRFLAYNLDYDRKTAFVFYAPFESRHRYVVHVPASYKLESTPEDKAVKSKWGTFTVKVKSTPAGQGGRLLDLEFRMRLEKARVEPDDFEAFRDFHDEVSERYRVWLTFKPAQAMDDVAPLEALLHYVPDDTPTTAALAKLYLRQHKDGDARRVLARGLAYAPDDAGLWELSVQAAPDLAGEERAQRELVRLAPDDPKRGLALGAILVVNGKVDQASAVLEPLTAKGTATTRALAHAQLARLSFNQKKYDDALKHLAAAEKEDGDSVNTVRDHVLKGKIAEEQNRLKDAVAAYRLALVVEPENDESLQALTRVSLRLDDRVATLDYLRRYSVAVGDDVPGLLRAADIYLKLHEYDAAYELANRTREKTFHEKAQRILGEIDLHRGNATEAVKHLEKAEPNAIVVEALLRARMMLGQLGEVRALLERADKYEKPTDALRKTAELARRLLTRRAELGLKLKPLPGNDKAFNAALDAFVFAEQEQADGRPLAEVEARLVKVFDADIDFGPAFGLRGRVGLAQGKFTRALADAERAVKLVPNLADGYFVRGRIRLERRQEGALADLQRAAESGGRKDAEVLHSLADALFQGGKREEALKTQREAVLMRPNDKEMAEQLAAFEKATGGYEK